MSKPAHYLLIECSWKGQHPGRDYLDAFEARLEQVAAHAKGVRTAVASASRSQDGREIETFALRLQDRTSFPVIADAVIAELRELGIKTTVQVRLLLNYGQTSRQARAVTQTSDGGWEAIVVSPSNASAETYPQRIDYLSNFAQRYYAIAGDDVTAVLRSDAEANTFLGSLTADQRQDLARCHATIIKNGDHHWIIDWVNEDADGVVTFEKAKAIYFLVLLDRFVDVGLLGYQKSNQRLVDWNRLS